MTATHDSLLTGVRRIVFVGDSLTDGSAWPDWVVETLATNGTPGLRLFNAGVAGNTSAQVYARLQADVLSLQPDLVVLCIGTNDVNTGVTLDAYRQNLAAIAKAVREQGARMLLLTPPAMGDAKRNETLHLVDGVIRDVAAQYGCAVTDVHAAFEHGLTEGKALLGPDGVHHRIDGWRTMARSTLDALGCPAPLVEKTRLYPGTITDWWCGPQLEWKSGQPYPQPETDPQFDPAKAGWTHWDGAALRDASWWQTCWIDRGCVLPLGSVTPVAGKAAFAMTTIKAARAKTVLLRIGGSPPVMVWLNGVLVCDGTKLHGYHPDADRLEVKLRRGTNRLAVFSTWMFHIAIDVQGVK